MDRVACRWLIKKFVDPIAEFLFVPADKVMKIVQREGATPYDVAGVELGHHGKECSFDAILKKHGLTNNPALVLMAKIVNGADTDNSLWNQPETAGLNAIAEGFGRLGFKNDHDEAVLGYGLETFTLGRAGLQSWEAHGSIGVASVSRPSARADDCNGCNNSDPCRR